MSRPEDEYPNDQRKYPSNQSSPLRGALDDLQPRRAVVACATDEVRLTPGLESQIARLAPSRVTVLLRGGTQALQETVARALHDRSGRAIGPFALFDCAGLLSDAIEQQLFGGPAYSKDAKGVIHEAETGTLYVVSIDELPLLMQPRFLRFLDQDKLVRVVVSARHDLLAHVARGLFRQDLGERLMLIELSLPESGRSV